MRSIRSPGKRKIILAAISDGLTVAEAAKCAGCSWRAIYDWRNADPTFDADFKTAYSAGTDIYEAEARRRAFEDKSDVLLIFLLKCRDPHRFNRKMLAIGGDPDAPPVTVNSNVAMIYPRSATKG
jgi:hypothetical protein